MSLCCPGILDKRLQFLDEVTPLPDNCQLGDRSAGIAFRK
jgi:hypothetical protein